MLNLSIPMPEHVAALPRSADGVPIPFWTHGQYAPTPEQLQTAAARQGRGIRDALAALRCAAERRCFLCGREIGWWVCFLGRDQMIEAGLFPEPPQHRDCARWCVEAGFVEVEGPPLAVYVTRSFECYQAPLGTNEKHLWFRAAPAKFIDHPQPQVLVRPGGGIVPATLVLP